MDIYESMYQHFGPRHWWPAETPFEVVVGAVLTQSVAWRNVKKAIQTLKDNNAMDLKVLAQMDLDRLGEWIRPTRYFNMKAKKLQSFCRHVLDHYNGSLECFFEKDVQELRRELLGIYGIGEETADSILLYAAGKPIFVVDAYTKRIFSRMGLIPEESTYQQMQRFFMENLPPDVQLYNEYHALIDGVGNRFCSNKNPSCQQCPIGSLCRFDTQRNKEE